MEKTNGVNLPWSTCGTLSLYALFSFSLVTWQCCSNLLRYRQTLGSNTQNPRARAWCLASLDLFAVRLRRFSPLNGTSFGSISVSKHTSDNIFAVRSLNSLCLIVAKPPFLQPILCVSNLLPHGQVGNFEISHPCLKPVESQNCCSKPCSAMGNTVSQLDTPFSVLNCKSRLDFSDMSSLRCSICLYVFSFLFLISNLIFVIGSSSTVFSICWTVTRLVSCVVTLHELLYSTPAWLWTLELLIHI